MREEERQRETEGQGRFILNECAADASHKCAYTLADSRSHVYSAIVSPFFLSISHSSIPSHSVSHDPSRMLSHIGSSPGSGFSCSLLGCNNYSISKQCVR